MRISESRSLMGTKEELREEDQYKPVSLPDVPDE
jgi:hypothetical protein